jgi:mannan endo-1,4-beta-mannosidase
MAWQLSNEPRPGHGKESSKWLEEYYRWINATAEFIHTLDHNHLISTGSEGIAGSVDSTEIFLTAHKSRNIDYLTFHLWPYDWGWYNPDQVDSTFLPSENKAIGYINTHIYLARVLDKPIVMEEFGLPRDNRKRNIGSPTTIKDKYFEKILSMVYNSANNGAPIAGANVWFWGGEGNPRNLSYEWGFGNPVRPVDNFNSVYYSDTSTVNILSKYAGKMSSINKEFNNR